MGENVANYCEKQANRITVSSFACVQLFLNNLIGYWEFNYE